MKGWQIFTHSVRQVFGNLPQALRVSAALYLAQAGAALAVGINLFDQADMQAIEVNPPWGALPIVVATSLVCGLWIAVAWHRYVLLVETPATVLPAFRFDRMLSYLGRTLLIALIMIPVGIVVSLIAGLFATILIPLGQVVAGVIAALIVVVPVLVVAMRLCASLPGVALGAEHGIGSAWRATAGQTGTLVVLSLAATIASLLIDLPGALILGPGSLAGTVWLFLTGWVKTMVGISILTTLYGHYIEGRTLV